MEYSNQQIPEGINTSKSHPLKEFMWLTSGVVASIVIVMLVLILLSDFIASYIPFRFEEKISDSVIDQPVNEGPLTDYLQSLADKITLAENLPKDFRITVHYQDSDTVNAYATLGGHIFLFRGLLEKLSNENALSMVLAHEIAHIKHRHPIKSISRGVLIGLALSAISSSSNDTLSEGLLNNTGVLTVMKYNRDMETEADHTATAALIANYGHLLGANDLFNILQQQSGELEVSAFFSTHPLNKDRIKDINNYMEKHPMHNNSKITPLPKNFDKWLN